MWVHSKVILDKSTNDQIHIDTNLKQTKAQTARAESTHKGVNQRSKYVTQVRQQRPESPTVTLTRHSCKYKVQNLHLMYLYLMYLCIHRGCAYFTEDVPLVEFMYLVFTHTPGESYRRRHRSLLLCLCDVFRALINSLVCWFCTSALGLVLFEVCTLWQQKLVNYISLRQSADSDQLRSPAGVLV